MRLLVLGAGGMQEPVFSMARQLGHYTIAFDGNPEAPQRDASDEFYCVDISDLTQILTKARELHSRDPLHGVFTAGTDFSTSVAWIGESLGLPGIPYKAALQAKDKGLMREVLAQAGLNVPRFQITDKVDFDCQIDFPLVVKPVDNMGARGVIMVSSQEELSVAVEEALTFSFSRKAIIEEFMEGPEYSLDSLIYKDQFYPCGMADRDIQFPPYFIEMGHHFPSKAAPEVQKALWEALEKGARALGITQGAAKGDLKWYKGKAYIGEIAARLSGGFMSGWTYPLHSGIHPTHSAIQIALGSVPHFPPSRESQSVQERAVISLPGVVEEYIGLEKICQRPEYRYHFIQKPPGSRVSFPVNNVQKCLNLILCTPSRDEAITLTAQIIPRLKASCRETRDFLTGDQEPQHPCFPENFAFAPLEEVGELKALPLVSREYPFRDWQGRNPAEAMKLLSRITGLPQKANTPVPQNFHKAFSRGSVQGGLWFIDALIKKD